MTILQRFLFTVFCPNHVSIVFSFYIWPHSHSREMRPKSNSFFCPYVNHIWLFHSELELDILTPKNLMCITFKCGTKLNTYSIVLKMSAVWTVIAPLIQLVCFIQRVMILHQKKPDVVNPEVNKGWSITISCASFFCSPVLLVWSCENVSFRCATISKLILRRWHRLLLLKSALMCDVYILLPIRVINGFIYDPVSLTDFSSKWLLKCTRKILPIQYIFCLPRGLFPVGCVQKIAKGRYPLASPIKGPNHLYWLLAPCLEEPSSTKLFFISEPSTL